MKRRSKMTTVEKKVSFLRALLTWTEQETMISGLTGPLQVRAEAISYEAFTADELKAMFESEPYRVDQSSIDFVSTFPDARSDQYFGK